MKFLSVRDLRGKSAQIWKELPDEREMIVTNNGRPIAILAAITEANLEESLSAFRRSRAVEAVVSLQRRSVGKGTDKISLAEINAEIKSVRKKERMMDIVIDTNVLVAGLLSPFGACGEIVRMVSAGELTLSFDARILSEYSEVLRCPKFGFEGEKVAAFLDYIVYRGRAVAPSPLSHSLPDPGDEPFLEVTLASPAAYLVTGNQKHSPPERCQDAKVISPNDFLIFFKYQQAKKKRISKRSTRTRKT